MYPSPSWTLSTVSVTSETGCTRQPNSQPWRGTRWRRDETHENRREKTSIRLQWTRLKDGTPSEQLPML